MGKMIELENRTRAVLHFPVFERGKPPEGAPAKARGMLREVSRLVLGDAADAKVAGERDTKLQPSPVARLTEDEYKRLGERNIRALEALVARGDVQRRELVA